jgi:L-alanine-DL-glutamate epimerase-like enolase superfamily enzyme
LIVKVIQHIQLAFNTLLYFYDKVYNNYMLSLSYSTHQIPFIYPFRTAHGSKTEQATLIVKLGFRNFFGYGEATEIVYYNVLVQNMIEKLESKRHVIENYSLISPDRFWHFLHHLFPEDHFLVCALDMAAWDLFAKLRNKQIHELWQIPWHNNTLTDYTIGIDDKDFMLEKMRQNPWPIYKVKLGTPNDIDIIENLRANTKSIIRIDANAGWVLADALKIIPELQKLDVELIEQPLAKDAWEEMHELFAKSNLPLIADEACVVEQDVAKCCPVFHGINIKLTKCSGLTPALRMIQEARAKQKLVMMGCMNESMVGTAAMAQFLPQLDYFDGDGPLLHSTELAEGLQFDNGKVILGNYKGLGIKVLV